MLDLLGHGARWLHIGAGFVGLAAFWVPVIAAKGGRWHITAGRIFVRAAYVVLAAAAIALLARTVVMIGDGRTPLGDPQRWGFIVFLGYLTAVTFVIIRHGMTVLQHKRNHAAMRTPLNVALAAAAALASVAVITYALIVSPPSKILLLALSPIGILTGGGILRFLRNEPASPRAWFYEHLGAMLGAGIAFHTAFFVFGASRLFDFGLTGWVAILPWIAPTLIGVPATNLWTRHYQRRFGELA